MTWRFRRKKSVPAQPDFGFLKAVEDEFARMHTQAATQAADALNKSPLLSASYDDVRGSLTLNGPSASVTISTADSESAQNICSMPNLESVTMLTNVRENRLVVFCVSRSWQYAVKGIVSTAEGANQCD
jgi:hypothetical protein